VPDDLHIPPAAGGHAYHTSYRAQTGTGDGMTRKLMVAAVVLGGALLAGMGGWALLGHRSAAVPLIEADGRPLRVKPDNAGGMQVAGADEQVMGDQAGRPQAMAPRAEAPAPQALRAQLQPPAVAGPDAVRAAPAGPSPAAPSPAALSSGASPLPDTPRTAGPAARPASPAGVAAGVTLVQLAAVDTEQVAQAEWQRLARRMPDILGDRRPVLQRAERDGKAVWRVRTGGFADVADATAFCARLRAKGASCTIAAF
jgi:hypothetical protein